jgi:hypothetical protein
MANGGIIGPAQTPVVTPASSQPETITGITAPSPAFAVQPLTTEVTVMVIAGGGGGQVAGGGAGGLRIISNHPVPLSSFPVTIGAGGPGSGSSLPQSGSNSTFGSAVPISSTGGGAKINTPGNGTPGGSGSGAFSSPGGSATGGTGNAGSYSPPEGNSGGGATAYSGGGGGGSGGTGAVGGPWPGTGGAGGAGTNTAPTFGAAPQPYYPAKSPGPTNAFFAGGGGGASTAGTGGAGGTGGGGGGVNGPPGVQGGSGDTNSGSGGGGHFGDASAGGAGGSGMVIVKEPAVSIPATIVAPGVWSLNNVYDYRKSGDWLGD